MIKMTCIFEKSVVKEGKSCENDGERFSSGSQEKGLQEVIMASEQVSLVMETEKKAAQIEMDARRQAEELISSAKTAALTDREAVLAAADDAVGRIFAAAQEQVDHLLRTEENSSADAVSILLTLAGQRKEKAVKAAVNMLIGKA